MVPYFAKIAAIFILVCAVSVPLDASALGTSFGGRVAAIHPCKGGWQVYIVPAGRFQPAYVWTVGSIGPVPFRIGQYILGIADAPLFTGTCVGQRIQRNGLGL